MLERSLFMAFTAGILATWLIDGDSQIVVYSTNWSTSWTNLWDIHCSWTLTLSGSGGGSPAQMGLVLPPGAQSTDAEGKTMSYWFLIQNAGDLEGQAELCWFAQEWP
jgi:hypothetical protein